MQADPVYPNRSLPLLFQHTVRAFPHRSGRCHACSERVCQAPRASDAARQFRAGDCVVHRHHFERVGGHDDVLANYGGEDLELYERLAIAKVDSRIIDEREIVEVIDHTPASASASPTSALTPAF